MTPVPKLSSRAARRWSSGGEQALQSARFFRNPPAKAWLCRSSRICRSLRALWTVLCLSVLLLACGRSPEEMLVGRWEEVEWRYEKFDGPAADQERTAGGRWIDGFRFPQYARGTVQRHEAEYWEFKPGSLLEITLRSGEVLQARWRLKGRGHVLTIRRPGTDDVELYDLKVLNSDELVLNYDIGMEVRGIAQLKFRRVEEQEASREESPNAVSAPQRFVDPNATTAGGNPV